MAGRSLTSAEILTQAILDELYSQEIVPLPHPAMVIYSPDQVRKMLRKHLDGRCLAKDTGEINPKGQLLTGK